MPTISTTATKSLDMLAAALHALDTIGELTSSKMLTSHGALDLLYMIGNVIETISKGFDGKVDARSIHDSFLKLRTDLLLNDRDADTELDKKFPR